MIKKILAVIICIIVSQNAFALANISLFFGMRYPLTDDLDPVDELFVKGARLDIGEKNWLTNIAADFYMGKFKELRFAQNELSHIEQDYKEIRLGLRKYFGNTVRLFLGAGVSNVMYSEKLMNAKNEYSCKNSTGWSFFKNGSWYELGFDYGLGENFSIGITGSYTDGQVKCEYDRVRLNGAGGGLILGIKF